MLVYHFSPRPTTIDLHILGTLTKYSSDSYYSIEANRSIELAISKISYKHRVEVIQI